MRAPSRPRCQGSSSRRRPPARGTRNTPARRPAAARAAPASPRLRAAGRGRLDRRASPSRSPPGRRAPIRARGAAGQPAPFDRSPRGSSGEVPEGHGQRLAPHVPALTAKPNESTQKKSPLIVGPTSSASNVQLLPSAKMNGSKRIVMPSRVTKGVPKMALSVTKHGAESGRQKKAPETKASEAQSVNAMSTDPLTLVAVPNQSAGVPSGQSAGVPATQTPHAQSVRPSHRFTIDGVVVVVVAVELPPSVVVGPGVVLVVVVVAGAGHVAPPHASQQLARSPTQAVPPLGGLHAAALLLMLHVWTPRAFVRQQVAKPGRPQVDCAAHRLTFPLQAVGSVPALAAALATAAAHLT